MSISRTQILGKGNGFSGPRKRVSPPNPDLVERLSISKVNVNERTLNAAIIAMIALTAKMPTLRPTSYKLFMALASAADWKTGHCYPSVESLARSLGVSEQAIRTARAELEAVSLIAVETNASNLLTNNYYLNFSILDPAAFRSFAAGTGSFPATNNAPSLVKDILGETDDAGWNAEDRELIRHAAELDLAND